MAKNKITDKKIKEISELREIGWSQEKIAKTLGISRSAVRYYIEKAKNSEEEYGNPFTRAYGSKKGKK